MEPLIRLIIRLVLFVPLACVFPFITAYGMIQLFGYGFMQFLGALAGLVLAWIVAGLPVRQRLQPEHRSS